MLMHLILMSIDYFWTWIK